MSITKEIPAANQQLLRSLLSCQYQFSNAWKSRAFVYKFMLRCFWYPRVSYHYIHDLMAFPDFPELLKRQETLLAKIHRPYLSRVLSVKERAKSILSHYSWIAQLPDGGFKRVLQVSQDYQLAQWRGKGDESLELYIAPTWCDREGELMIKLRFQDEEITTLSFTLRFDTPTPTLFIGGLQGARNEQRSEVIRQATKACYGLFPKRLVLEMACLIAQAAGISTINAVGDRTHIFSDIRYRASKKDKFLASYSEFWDSLGAEQDHLGIYQLRLPQQRKPLDEIASKKRAEYRRRYELLDSLHQQFNQALAKKD